MLRRVYWQIQLEAIKSRQENGAVLKSMNYSGIQMNLSHKVNNQMPIGLYGSSHSTTDLMLILAFYMHY